MKIQQRRYQVVWKWFCWRCSCYFYFTPICRLSFVVYSYLFMNLTHFTLIWAQLELWAIKNSIEHVQWKCPDLVMFSLSAVIETSKKCAKTFLKIPRWFFPYSKQKYSFDSHKYSKNHSEHFHFFHSMVSINILCFCGLRQSNLFWHFHTILPLPG